MKKTFTSVWFYLLVLLALIISYNYYYTKTTSIELEIISSVAPNVTVVFFDVGKGFNKHQRTNFRIEEADEVYTFKAEIPRGTRKIRIDPIATKGDFVIKSIKFYNRIDEIEILNKPDSEIRKTLRLNEQCEINNYLNGLNGTSKNNDPQINLSVPKLERNAPFYKKLFLASIIVVFVVLLSRIRINKYENKLSIINNKIDNILNIKNIEIFIPVGLTLIIGIILFEDFIFGNSLYLYNDIGSDTNTVFYPYFSAISDYLLSFNFTFWSFKSGLGQPFEQNWFFSDPLNSLFLLMGKKNYLLALPYYTIIKYLFTAFIFSLYLRKLNLTKPVVVISSLLYTFSGFMTLAGQWYLYSTIVMYMALFLYTFEIWFENRKIFIPLIAAIVLIIMWEGLYHLYQLSLFTFLYASVRYFLQKEKIDISYWKYFLLLFAILMLSILVSSYFLLPQTNDLLNSPRTAKVGNDNFLINIFDSIFIFLPQNKGLLTFYKFYSNVIFNNGNSFLGMRNILENPQYFIGIISIMIIPLIFSKSNSKEKTIFTIIIIVILSYIFLYGFRVGIVNLSMGNYYRFSAFLIVILCIFLFSISFNKILNSGINKNTLLVISSILFFILFSSYIIVQSLDIVLFHIPTLLISLSFILLYTFILYKWNNFRFPNLILLLMLIFISSELTINGYCSINFNRILFSKSIIKNKTGYFDDTNEALNNIKQHDKSFYRIIKTKYSQSAFNEGLQQNYFSTDSYYSFNIPSYIDFCNNLELNSFVRKNPKYILPYKDRNNINSLLSIKYILKTDNSKIPQGYEKIDTAGTVEIYRNKNYLPLGFTYNKQIDLTTFNKMTHEEKDITLLQAFVADTILENYQKLTNSDNVPNINFEISGFSNMDVIKNNLPKSLTFKATNGDPRMFISLKDTSLKTLIVNFDIKSPTENRAQIYYRSTKEKFSGNRCIHSEKYKGKAKINEIVSYQNIAQLRLDPVVTKGKFVLKNLKIENRTGILDNAIKNLREDTLQITHFEEDHIKGTINLDSRKMLFFSIPFHKGWRAKVNGKQYEIKKINIGMMGLDLPQGDYEIELKYRPPYYVLSIIHSLLGIFLAVFSYFIIRKRDF